MKVHRSQSVRQMKVTTDGEGLVSHSGTALLAELADRSGLTEAMSVAMGDCGHLLEHHDPGVVLTHLAVAIADGADCLSQLAVLRDQEALFGPVASHATAWRAVQAVASVELRRHRRRPGGSTSGGVGRRWGTRQRHLDFDATLVDAYSDKQDAAPTYKRGFGFHPLGVWCDETHEALAGMLRAGNAGANTAADHVKVLDDALAQLPPEWRAGHGPGDDPAGVVHPILARADSAGATHDFVDALVERNIGYSIGFDVDGRVRDARCWSRRRTGFPPSRATATPARGRGWSSSPTSSTSPPGPPAPASSAGANDPTPAPSCRCSTPTRASVIRAFSPALPESHRAWSCARAATPGWRTASAAPRPAGFGTCPSRTSSATRRGSP